MGPSISFSAVAVSFLFCMWTLLWCACVDCRPHPLQDEMKPFVKAMINHAYGGYMERAFPHDELKPMSGEGVDTLGAYALTLVDSLDLLALSGQHDEFRWATKWVVNHVHFDVDRQVSVFETSIRILGGLLSAHFMYEEGVLTVDDDSNDDYDGGLLRLAVDLADRLLPAFETKTGIPYGSINLRHGVPVGEIEETSTAGGGTFLLEFTVLSAMTMDPKYEIAARKATLALIQHRAMPSNLVGNHVNITSGRWTLLTSSVGSGIDSLMEYLIKTYALTADPMMFKSYEILHDAFGTYTRRGPWYLEMNLNGGLAHPVHNSLAAFYPGNLAMSGKYLDEAVESCFATHYIMRKYGAIPEGFHLGADAIVEGQRGYPLRPEHAESLYMLFRVTRDPIFLRMGKEFATMLWTRTATSCGFAALQDCNLPPHQSKHVDAMESFILSETLKYLWLLFDDDNVLHTPWNPADDAWSTNGDDGAVGWVFNTEGHPIPIRLEWRWWRMLRETKAAAPRSNDTYTGSRDRQQQAAWAQAKQRADAEWSAFVSDNFPSVAEAVAEHSAWSDHTWCPVGRMDCLFDNRYAPSVTRSPHRDVQMGRPMPESPPTIVDSVESIDTRFQCTNRQPRSSFERLSKGLYRKEVDINAL